MEVITKSITGEELLVKGDHVKRGITEEGFGIDEGMHGEEIL